jgi:hypothetical protein
MECVEGNKRKTEGTQKDHMLYKILVWAAASTQAKEAIRAEKVPFFLKKNELLHKRYFKQV